MVEGGMIEGVGVGDWLWRGGGEYGYGVMGLVGIWAT